MIGLLQYFGHAAPLDPWVNQTPAGEAYANLRQRNQFASLTNIALAALLWLAAHRRDAAGRTKTGQMVFAAGGLLLALGNAASSSRTGLMQLILLCVLAGVWGQWRCLLVLRLLVVAGVGYLAATLALPAIAGLDPSINGVLARLYAGDELCASRLTLWSNVMHLISQKPWLGWGWGELDYAHYITLYDGPRFCDILDNAHNLPLHLAVELGIPFAALVCGGFAWWVWRQRPWRETDPTRQLAWSVLAVILLHSMLEYPLWYGPFQMAFGLCLVLLWQTRLSRAESGTCLKTVPDPRGLKILSAVVAVSLMAASAFAAWDYHRISQIYLAPAARDADYRTDTLAKIRGSRIFSNQVRFAELLLTPLTRDNAQWTFDTASDLLHFSPEPRVIEKLIESAVMLNRNADALKHLSRYQAAFPQDYARWAKANARPISALRV